MIWSKDPQKELQSIFKKMEMGKVNESNLDSLVQLLDKQPSMVPEAIKMLTRLSQNGDIKVCSSVISTFNKAAEKDFRIPADSVNVIVCCMQKGKQGFNEDLMLDALEILLKIYQEYPEHMSIAVPELLACLENISPKIRNKAYLILDSLVATRTEFFLGRSKELIRVLNSLSVDARIYGCRLIMNISVKNPVFVMDTYAAVEDLRQNHPDHRLRSEAGYAAEKLKPKEQPAKPDAATVEIAKPVKDDVSDVDLISYEKPLYECTNLVIPDDADLKTMLETMGLKHLIKKI
ncbi:MAG: hypothetical protein Q7J35_10135 [Candidatus Methanoperedens sp.]|nr:hypothetical protein [Candidatus Methanoperedens sp.]